MTIVNEQSRRAIDEATTLIVKRWMKPGKVHAHRQLYICLNEKFSKPVREEAVVELARLAVQRYAAHLLRGAGCDERQVDRSLQEIRRLFREAIPTISEAPK